MVKVDVERGGGGGGDDPIPSTPHAPGHDNGSGSGSPRKRPASVTSVLSGSRPEAESIIVNFFLGRYHEPTAPTCLTSTFLCQTKTQEIVKFHQYKYGLPHTGGNFWYNFWSFQRNNQEVLSIFLASPLNPVRRWHRLFIFACTLSTTLLVNSFFIGQTTLRARAAAVAISVAIQQPLVTLLRQVAQMELCEKTNCCVTCAHALGNFVFVTVSWVVIAIFLTIAVLSLTKQDKSWVDAYIRQVFFSLGLGYAKTAALELPNWVIDDWDKVCLSRRPLLRAVLNLAFSPLCDETYASSRRRFLASYDGCLDVTLYCQAVLAEHERQQAEGAGAGAGESGHAALIVVGAAPAAASVRKVAPEPAVHTSAAVAAAAAATAEAAAGSASASASHAPRHPAPAPSPSPSPSPNPAPEPAPAPKATPKPEPARAADVEREHKLHRADKEDQGEGKHHKDGHHHHHHRHHHHHHDSDGDQRHQHQHSQDETRGAEEST